MKKLLRMFSIMFLSMILIVPVWANDKINMALQEYAWEKRQLIVFTPSVMHPEYQLFLKVFSEFKEEFNDRKLHTWIVILGEQVMLEDKIQLDLKNNDFRETFGVSDKEFKVLLIGYDQEEKLRQDKVQIDLLFAEIDQMPMRIQEMQE